MKFEDLNVRAEIVRALTEIGITEPTQIQEKAIPIIKSRKDMIGMSKTGSGKTAAFGIPLLEMINPREGIQAIILSPTRELAVQTANEFRKFGKYLGVSIATVYGGVSLSPQVDQMRRSEIIVATPGRILDHLRRGSVKLSKVSCVILDEADKMAEMGFIEDVSKIINETPQGRQILLFGATISEEINRLKQRYMKNPETASAELQVAEDLLAQYYYEIELNEKFSLLVHLLNKEELKQAIIFCSARSTVEMVARNLRKQGVRCELVHGKLSQNRRLSVIENFNKGKPNVLVASSVAARGLDIKDVSHIFNYDLSRDSQEYIHRVGRTARAGESGKAITLLSANNHNTFREIIHKYGVKVVKLDRENFSRIRFETGMGSRSFDRGNRNSGRFGNRTPKSHGRYRREEAPQNTERTWPVRY